MLTLSTSSYPYVNVNIISVFYQQKILGAHPCRFYPHQRHKCIHEFLPLWQSIALTHATFCYK